jgi:hypothetical protein
MSKRKEAAKGAAQRRKQRVLGNALIRNRAVAMLESGMIRSRIAEQLGVTPATITRWLKECGVEPVNRPPSTRGAAGDAPEIADMPLSYEYADTADDDEPDEFQQNLAESLAPPPEEDTHPLLAARDEEEQGLLAVAENQAAPADKYQAFVAASAIRMFRDSLPHIRGPRTVKEMSELDQMIRRNLGLNPKGGSAGGSVKIDISILNNTKADLGGSAIPQRVVEADIVDYDDEEDED